MHIYITDDLNNSFDDPDRGSFDRKQFRTNECLF